ncbi:hypothetical protein [Streptomyces sp. bgisy100]|uniref:hypothetical protein n=1 Tax=Streptomyces sp. bgisy100 TaxID=3413783 RepID=UPI003D72B043
MPRRNEAVLVEVTSVTVQRGDVITIGGLPCRVMDLITLPARAKRLRFTSGETLTMHPNTRLSALRAARR